MRSRVGKDFTLVFSLIVCWGLAPKAFAEQQWVEVKSPHFSVITDAGEKRGREVAVRFEQMRSVFGALLSKVNVNIPIPLQIVAFRNSKELKQVAPLFHGKPIELAGLFQGGQDRSFIMLDMAVENPWTVVFHEYAHQLMNGALTGAMDPWFEEGFAEYFSTIEVDGKQARVGKVPQYEYDILAQQGFAKVSDLLKVQYNSATYNENGNHRTTFYAESGLLVHYLYDNGLIPKLAMYFTLKVDQGMPVDDAIQRAFGMSAAQLDKALRIYANSGAYRYYAIPTPTDIIEKGYSVKPLTALDASAVIADIHLHSPDYRDQAISEFQQILQGDPNNAAACRGLGYAYLQKRDFKQAGDYFKRAVAADSTDPRIHYYAALMMNQNLAASADSAEMIHELETAVALDPSFADAHMLLGYAFARAGDRPKALASMQKAVSLNPRNENYRFNLAQIYLSNRQPDRGIEILQELTKSSDPMIALRARESLRRAEEYKNSLQAERTASVTIAGTGPREVNDAALMQSMNREKATASSEEILSQVQQPMRFLKGTIVSVDCSATPVASLSVTANQKTWTLDVKDTNHVLVLGGDAFSCGWKQKKAAINYRETGDGTGSVVSIELQ